MFLASTTCILSFLCNLLLFFNSRLLFRPISVHFLNNISRVILNECILGQNDIVAKATNDGTARFLVIGDWGGLPFFPYDSPSEKAVADAMGKMGARLNTSFQLALGDNFYYQGVESVTDPRFQVRFSLRRNEVIHFPVLFFRKPSKKYSPPNHYKHLGIF